MSVRDPFSYAARWDSVGLTCSSCSHFEPPPSWPDNEFIARCQKHGIRLVILYDPCGSGYLGGEYFCSEYEDGGGTFAKALEDLEEIRSDLADRTLYAAYNEKDQRRTLKEIPFSQLPNKLTPKKSEVPLPGKPFD